MPPVFSAATIVALGKFNPDVFRPDSLRESKTLSAAEAARSEVVALLPSRITHFTLPWGELLALPDRLQTTATEAPFVRIADLIASTMNKVAEGCSIRAFGINFESHFDVGSIAQRDSLAMKLAPAAAWGKWGNEVQASMQTEDMERHGGVALLTMREQFWVDDVRGWYDVTLTTSEKVPNNAGVKFVTNHHHEYAPDRGPATKSPSKEQLEEQTNALLRALAESFDSSISKAERIFAEVLA